MLYIISIVPPPQKRFLKCLSLGIFLEGDFSSGPSGKEFACQCRREKRHGLDPWAEIPWRRKWQPAPESYLENSMDRGAWWATVHGAQSYITEHCIFIKLERDYDKESKYHHQVINITIHIIIFFNNTLMIKEWHIYFLFSKLRMKI